MGAGNRRFKSGHPDCLKPCFRWSSCWYGYPAVTRGDAGSIPAAGARRLRKGKPIGDGTRPDPGRALSLEGSTPSPSACRPRDWSKGTTPGFQPGDRGSTPRSRTRMDRGCVPGRAVRCGPPRPERGVRIPCLPFLAPMVKWRSCLASNEEFRVRVLVGALIHSGGSLSRPER